MPDCFPAEKRSDIMRKIKGSNTQLELSFRSRLWAAGMRYRVTSRLPGKPDLVFPAARVSVFVDSCFFHACPKHCRFPKSNQSYWTAKLSRNRERDRLVAAEHRKLGWKIIRVWEHSIKTRPEACVSRIKAAVLSRSESMRMR
jgi:DNA mismatch endonuclease, patch repair protein